MTTTSASSAAAIPAKRRFLRPQFTLATLLILITVSSPFFAYVASVRRWNHHRKLAYSNLLAKGADFRPRGRSNPKAKSKDNFLHKSWKTITADPNVPGFGIITLAESVRGGITDKDLRSLEYFPEIEEFHCHGSAAVTDDGLAVLSELPNLKMVVGYYLPNVTGDFLAEFPKDCKLDCLGFHNCNGLEGKHLAPLSRLQNLTQLSISDVPLVNDESLRDVELPASLTNLHVNRVKIGDATFARWFTQAQLKTLHIHAPITRAIAPAFSKLTAIEELSIQDAPLIDEDFAFLTECHQLGRLSLLSMPVRGELLAFIPHPKKLHGLNLSNTLFSDEHLSKLSKFPNLSGLDLAWTPLTGEGFNADTGLPRPGMFFLTGTRFSDQGKEAFSKFKGLNTVQLPSNWSPVDHQRFADSDKPANPQFNSYFRAPPGGQTWGPPTLRQEPMDNCPSDLMKPIANLHALGLAEEQEIKRRQGRSP